MSKKIFLIFLIINFSFFNFAKAEGECSGKFLLGSIPCYLEIVFKRHREGEAVKIQENISRFSTLSKLLQPKPNSTTKGFVIPNSADLTKPILIPGDKKPEIPENFFDPNDVGQRQILGTVLDLTGQQVENPATLKRAIEGFQRTEGLTPTGKIDRPTATAIENNYDKILQQKEIKDKINGEIKNEEVGQGGQGAKCNGIEFTNEDFMKKVGNSAEIHSSGKCTDFNRSSCTSLAGMQSKVAKFMNSLAEKCKTKITITGGTECGHSGGGDCGGRNVNKKYPSSNHAPGNAVFDMSKNNSALNECVAKLAGYKNIASGSFFNPVYQIDGVVLNYENSSAPHWHINASGYKCSE